MTYQTDKYEKCQFKLSWKRFIPETRLVGYYVTLYITTTDA